MSCVGLNIYYHYLEQPCIIIFAAINAKALIFYYEEKLPLSLIIAFIYENKCKYLEGSLVLGQLS